MFVVALFYGALFYVFFRTIPKIYVFLWRYKLTHMDNALKIYTLTSALHDAESIRRTTQCFLDTIGIDYGLCDDFGDFGTSALSLIFVRTGGTEGLFRELLPRLTQKNAGRPFYLLASETNNSLAASLEILSFLRQQGLTGEVVHGKADYVRNRIEQLLSVQRARRRLHGMRLGIIGEPSDWLISSQADSAAIMQHLGISLIDLPIDELVRRAKSVATPDVPYSSGRAEIQAALPGAMSIYEALKAMATDSNLQGLTLRCFDLLTSLHNTGCIALARLNAEGITSSCEGDVPALLSMVVARALLGTSGFQANPARIDVETGEILFAHCTIPFDLVDDYSLDTHFESGIGVGICGHMPEGPVTIFKVSGDLSRHFVCEGELTASQSAPNYCRTQQLIRLCSPQQASCFLTNPIGNHHIIMPGHHRRLIEAFMQDVLSEK